MKFPVLLSLWRLMGNSDVRLKHKVQLRRKVDDSKLADKSSIENSTTRPTSDAPKSRKMIWLIIGVIVLCFLGYFIFSKPDNDGQKPVVVEDKTEVENISVPSDTTNSKEAVKEGVGETESEVVENSNYNVDESTAMVESVKPTETTTIDNAKTSVRTTNVSNDVEAEAMKVIRGDYGIGQERKNKLGDKYQTIQNRVNELKREGLF